MNDWEKSKVVLSYGYQEAEDGIYHAFKVEDPDHIGDAEDSAKELAELLDTTPDDDRFNWNSMHVEIPKETIKRLREEGRQEILSKVALKPLPDQPSGYLVRQIGSDAIGQIEVKTWEEGIEALKVFYQEVLDEHDGGSWFDEMDLDETNGCFTITAEEFFQYAEVVKMNDFTGPQHTIEEIRRCADDAATYANCYEYELQDMQGVFDMTSKIKGLADRLEQEIAAKDKSRYEMSYIDFLSGLHASISSDACMPDIVATKATELLDRLKSILTPYSA